MNRSFDQNKKLLLFILLIVFLILVSFFSLKMGTVSIEYKNIFNIILTHLMKGDVSQLSPEENLIIWTIRLPRILLGLMVGMLLASSGSVMQGIFRNSLADPGLMGISSGAALFVAMGVVAFGSSLGVFSLSLFAFLGSVLAMLVIFFLSTKNSKTNIATMLLAGIAINALCGAGTSIFTYLSSNEELRTITFWQLGSLANAGWDEVLRIFPFFLGTILVFPILAKPLDAMLLGDANAKYLGVKIERVKFISILMISLAVGATVATCGMISFVGLVIPHLVRMLLGPSHKGVIVGSMLLGGILIILSDLVARTFISPLELPIGVVTSLIGAPFFLYLLINKRSL